MRTEYDLKFKDVARFQAIHQFLSPAVQAVFLLGAGFVFLAERGDGNEPTPALAVAVALTFYVAFWLFQLPLNAVLLVSRKKRQGRQVAGQRTRGVIPVRVTAHA